MSLENDYVIGAGSSEILHLLHPRLRYPDLWRGCVGAWTPSLGASGLKLVNNANGAADVLTNMDAATDWVVSSGQYALDLDSTNDYVSLSLTDYLMVTGRPFAVTWWENLTSSGVAYMSRLQLPTLGQASSWIAFMSTDAGYSPISWRFTNGASAVGIKASSGPTVASAVGVWRHWCITGDNATSSDAAKHSLYIDGVSYALTASSSVNNKTTSRIGYDGAISGANCLIDDVRVYSRRLNATEAQLLARRRGISYETVRRKVRRAEVAASATNGNNLLLLGVG